MEYIILKDLVDNGFSTYQIAKQTNQSQTNIRYWLRKYNLKTAITKSQGQNNCLFCHTKLTGKQIKFCSKECKKEVHKYSIYIRQKRTRNERKEYFIEQLGAKCSICGYDKSKYSLSFHHRENKKYTISSMLHNNKIETCQNEIDKCILVCINCHREIHNYQKEVCPQYKKQRAKYLLKREELLNILGGKCQKCGYNKHSFCLDFHHLRDKKFSLSMREMALKIPIEELKQEINKCIILCGNCHSEEHYTPKNK